MIYRCPVCGYDRLEKPPTNYSICKSCGTEFGYDDFATSHDELRQQWIGNGMRWYSRRVPPPIGWNPVRQLLSAGYGYSLTARSANTTRRTYSLPQPFFCSDVPVAVVEQEFTTSKAKNQFLVAVA